MTTAFVVSFLVGLALSVVSFASGFHRFHLRMPKLMRHAGLRKPHLSPFNMAAMTAFLTWFGGTGLVVQQLASPAAPIVVTLAVGAGSAGAAMVNRFIGALVRREKTVETLTMIGTIARVVVPIREGGGTGEIVFTHGGTRQVSGARSDCGVAIAKGTEVVVTKHEKGIAYVATWEQLSPTIES